MDTVGPTIEGLTGLWQTGVVLLADMKWTAFLIPIPSKMAKGQKYPAVTKIWTPHLRGLRSQSTKQSLSFSVCPPNGAHPSLSIPPFSKLPTPTWWWRPGQWHCLACPRSYLPHVLISSCFLVFMSSWLPVIMSSYPHITYVLMFSCPHILHALASGTPMAQPTHAFACWPQSCHSADASNTSQSNTRSNQTKELAQLDTFGHFSNLTLKISKNLSMTKFKDIIFDNHTFCWETVVNYFRLINHLPSK